MSEPLAASLVFAMFPASAAVPIPNWVVTICYKRGNTMNSRINKRGFVWGGLMILFGAMALIATFTEIGIWIWVGFLAVVGLLAFLVYLTDLGAVDLLIAPYALWALAGLLVMLEWHWLVDAWVPFYVLTAIALPFIIGFLRDMNRWGLLIPAYILIVVGAMVVLLEDVLTDMQVPAYVMFAIAIPFLVAFLRDRRMRWPLIPSGILIVVGITFLLGEALIEYITPVLLIFFGGWILLRQLWHREKDVMGEAAEKPSAH